MAYVLVRVMWLAPVAPYQHELEWEVLGFERRTIRAEPTIRRRRGEPAFEDPLVRILSQSVVAHLNSGERLLGFTVVEFPVVCNVGVFRG